MDVRGRGPVGSSCQLPRRTIGEIVQNSLFRLSICGRVGSSCALRAEGAERPIGNASLTCLLLILRPAAHLCVAVGATGVYAREVAQVVHSSCLAVSSYFD